MYISTSEVCKIKHNAIRLYLYSIGEVICNFVRYAFMAPLLVHSQQAAATLQHQ
jgi:hypothetical protein